MTPERFEQLADAYGADINRWPAAEQQPARELSAGDAALQRLLANAGGLDELLMVQTIEPASLALQMRMHATAAETAPAAAGWTRRASLWWSGLGLAGIGVAGAAAGVLAVSMVLPASAPASVENGWTDSASAFATMAAEAVEE